VNSQLSDSEFQAWDNCLLWEVFGKRSHRRQLVFDDDPEKMPNPEIADYERYWGKINNPTVHIGLNQIRLLVNELIRTYGKPTRIAVEFARALKLSRKQKKALDKEQKDNEERNKEINEKLNSAGIKENYENRMIVKIWQEQARNPLERMCPFCGKPIPFEGLFTGEFEVEHLLPFSRSYNDGYNNKVISCRSCNRIKTNKTPYEAFGTDPTRWNNILERVKRLPVRKQRCFREDALKGEKEIIERLLNDTKYLSRSAKKYLGAVCQPEKINAIPGQLTAQMREAWGLNTLLSDSHDKDRTDHRHHAIDAFIVACTSRAMLQALSVASAKGWLEKRRLFATPPSPFDGFRHELMQQRIDKMVVSHKPDHGNALRAINENKTVAALHKEHSYGFVRDCEKEGYAIFSIRKPLISFVKNDSISQIASSKIRSLIMKTLEGITDQKEREQKLRELSQKYNIRSIRIHEQKDKNTMAPIKDRRTGRIYRYVELGGNYCADIYQPNRGRYRNKWQVEVISYYHAHQKGFVPKWRKAEPEAKLIMRLFKDDLVAWNDSTGRAIVRVRKFNQDGRLYFEPHTVAKPKKDPNPTSGKQLQERDARKIKVDILGRVVDPFYQKGMRYERENC
jgi:CRISPR-associated endonuclease Csn1